MSGDHNQYQKPDKQCERCGEVNPAEIHTCTPQEPVIGTKTWFQDGKMVTRDLHPSDVYLDPSQEPVVWMGTDAEGNPNKFRLNEFGTATPLYTAPPQREWQGLTDEERVQCELCAKNNYFEFARAIEAKLKEKNT